MDKLRQSVDYKHLLILISLYLFTVSITRLCREYCPDLPLGGDPPRVGFSQSQFSTLDDTAARVACSKYSTLTKGHGPVSADQYLSDAKSVAVRVGQQTSTIKQETTRWLGFWLDPKLALKTPFGNSMASAKGALP